jgi:hypothetical protein
VLYSAVIPPWQGPDEPKHYEYIRLLYENRRLVSQVDTSLPLQREIIASMREYDFWRFGYSQVPEAAADSFRSMWWPADTELDRPPLYCILGAAFYSLVAHQPIVTQLYILRLVSVLLGVLTVLVAFLTIRELFPDDKLLSAGVLAFIVFLPMFTHITSSILNDSLASLVASAIIYLLIVSLKRGFSSWRILGLVLLLLMSLVTKRTTLFTIPLALLAVGIALSKTRRRFNWKAVGIITSVFLVVGGLIGWLWRSKPEQMRWIIDNYYADSSFSGYISALLSTDYFSPQFRASLWLSLQGVFRKFWGGFGWLAVYPDQAWYQIIGLVHLIALVGLIIYVVRIMNGARCLASWQKQGLLILLAGLGGNLALLMGKGAIVDYWSRAQGRYLFPAIIPIAVLFTLGVREVIPVRYHRAWLVAYIAGFILYDSIVLMRYIIPYFYS